MSLSDRELGMSRDITRRDFLNSVAVGLTGSMVAPDWLQAAVEQAGQVPEQAPAYYPPGLLARTLADGGFDPARDIAGITVNRWLHGYTYNYNTLEDPVSWALSTPEDRAFVAGRRRFGRISIANADAAGSSHTDAAIDMAFRAVREVVESRGTEHAAPFTKS